MFDKEISKYPKETAAGPANSRMTTCQNEEDDLIRPCHGSNPVLQVEHHLSTPTTSHSLEHRRG